MIKRLARYILRDELSDSRYSVSSLNARIDDLKETNEVLRLECEGIKDIKLRLRVAEMYIDDDAAIDELFAAKKNIELQSKDDLRLKLQNSPRFNDRYDYAAAQMQGAANMNALGQLGAYQGLAGLPFGGRFI